MDIYTFSNQWSNENHTYIQGTGEVLSELWNIKLTIPFVTIKVIIMKSVALRERSLLHYIF